MPSSHWISAYKARLVLRCGQSRVYRMGFRGELDWRISDAGEVEFDRADVMRAAREQPR